MAYILSIETATAAGSVAFHHNGVLRSAFYMHNSHSHSGSIAPAIQFIMNEAGVSLQELDAIAVGSGPGSYTGLRIGMSTAKGLCYSLGKPLIAIPTLQLMAAGMVDSVPNNCLLMPMLDARRMEVFTALYNTDLEEVKAAKPFVLTDEASQEEWFAENKSVIFAGDGSEKAVETLQKFGVHHKPNFNADARDMGELALKAYTNKQFEDVAYFEPFYLKEPISKT
jgi:tRNA threonylcarbamoyladenosine biosynthesis protein TsaB